MTSGCSRAIGSASSDPHTVCIVCRKGVCTVDNRCPECAEWEPRLVTSAFKYQHALQRKRDYKAKRKVIESPPRSPRVSPGQRLHSPSHFSVHGSGVLSDDPLHDGGSVRGSVGFEDSVSQTHAPGTSLRKEANQFFSDFAAFFGFSKGLQHSSFSELVSDLVAQHVDRHLAAHQSSLPAHSLSSAHGPVESGSNPPPDLSARQSVESLQADVSVEGSRGQVESSRSLAFARDATLVSPASVKRPLAHKDSVAG